MRDSLTTALETAGAVSVTVGAFILAAWLGFVVAGVLLIGAGFVLGGDE